MKRAALLIVVLLAGCDQGPVNPDQVKRLVDGCAPFGGVKRMWVQTDTKEKPLVAECKERVTLRSPYEEIE